MLVATERKVDQLVVLTVDMMAFLIVFIRINCKLVVYLFNVRQFQFKDFQMAAVLHNLYIWFIGPFE
jgi:hypothetical protein